MTRPKKPPRDPLKYIVEFLRLVVATGFIVDRVDRDAPAPVNCLLISPPGRGKTTAIERLRGNPSLRFQSDMTWKGFLELLYEARDTQWTHVVFPEFQKVFQRRKEVWENALGLLAQAVEEGVHEINVGDESIDLGGVRLGMLGAMTTTTLRRRHHYFAEMGLLSRTLIVHWDPPLKYYDTARSRRADGDGRDAKQPITLVKPDRPALIKIGPKIGHAIDAFIYDDIGYEPRDFRPSVMARQMVCAAAFLRDPHARAVKMEDVDYALYGYVDLWRTARNYTMPGPQKIGV